MAKIRSKDTPIGRIAEYGLEITGKYYSKYRGFVTENEDPVGLNRLKVIVPVMNANVGDDIWVWPANSWGGNNYGIQMLPQKGDMVWIEYEMGDVDHPIWSHASYGEDEKPKEFETPNHYGFKTPLGSIVLINDIEGEEEILVKHSSTKEYIKITKDTLELESTLIKLGKDGGEKAVLGDTLKQSLDNLTDKVNDLIDIMATHTHAGPAGPPIKAAQIKAIKVSIISIKNKYIKFLSNKVKIDK